MTRRSSTSFDACAWATTFALVGGLAHCGSSTSSSGPSGTYPAFQPNIGQIVNQGGTLLTSPKIVTVTWQSDPNASTFEAFGDKIGASSYWKTAVGQFGVGAATSGTANHVRIAKDLAATIEGTDLESSSPSSRRLRAAFRLPTPRPCT
jgi:hypothetical protein